MGAEKYRLARSIHLPASHLAAAPAGIAISPLGLPALDGPAVFQKSSVLALITTQGDAIVRSGAACQAPFADFAGDPKIIAIAINVIPVLNAVRRIKIDSSGLFAALVLPIASADAAPIAAVWSDAVASFSGWTTIPMPGRAAIL